MSTAKYNFYWVFVALFAVSLFYPFKAIAQDGPSTLTQFTTIDCPAIDVSGKDLYEKDCVQDILNQLHQSYNKEMISAEDAIRKDKEMISNEDTIRKDAEQAHLAESAALREQIKTMTTTIDQAKVAVEHMNKCMADSARRSRAARPRRAKDQVAARTSSISHGFARKASAPTAKAAVRVRVPPRRECTRTGTSPVSMSFFRDSTASNPVIPGRSRSMTTS